MTVRELIEKLPYNPVFYQDQNTPLPVPAGSLTPNQLNRDIDTISCYQETVIIYAM